MLISRRECKNINKKKIIDIIITYQKLKIAKVSGGGIEIIEFKPGIIIYGDNLDMIKLNDKRKKMIVDNKKIDNKEKIMTLIISLYSDF